MTLQASDLSLSHSSYVVPENAINFVITFLLTPSTPTWPRTISLKRTLPRKSFLSLPELPCVRIFPFRLPWIGCGRVERFHQCLTKPCYALCVDPEAIVRDSYQGLQISLIDHGDVTSSVVLISDNGIERVTCRPHCDDRAGFSGLRCTQAHGAAFSEASVQC